MILRRSEFAFLFGMLGALGELFGAFTGLGLRAVARRGLLPVVDLLLQCSLHGIVAGPKRDLALVGRGLHHGAADALGLEKRPEIRGLDTLADRLGLRA